MQKIMVTKTLDALESYSLVKKEKRIKIKKDETKTYEIVGS